MATALAVAGALAPAGATAAQDPVSVKLLGSGDLVDGGAAADVRVLVRCEPEPPLLEALVTGSQENTVGFAEGFFLDLTCDGRPHIETARAHTFDGERFRQGKAFFSAFVLLCDEVTGECFSGQDSRLVNLR